MFSHFVMKSSDKHVKSEYWLNFWNSVIYSTTLPYLNCWILHKRPFNTTASTSGSPKFLLSSARNYSRLFKIALLFLRRHEAQFKALPFKYEMTKLTLIASLINRWVWALIASSTLIRNPLSSFLLPENTGGSFIILRGDICCCCCIWWSAIISLIFRFWNIKFNSSNLNIM